MKITLKYFWDALTRFKKNFFIFFLLSIINAALCAFLPYATRTFIVFNTDTFNILFFCLGIAGFIVLYFIVNLSTIAWHRSLDDFGGKYIGNLSDRMMAAVSKTSLSEIDGIGSNNIKHILYSDNLDVFRIVGYYIPTILSCLVSIITAFVLSLFFDPIIAVFVLLSSVVGFILSWFSRKVISKAGKKENVQLKAVNETVNNFIQAISLVQTNNLETHYINNTTLSINEFIKTAKSADSKIYFFNGLISGYYSICSVLLSTILALPFAGASIVNLVFFTMISSIIISQSQRLETVLFQANKSQVSLINAEKLLTLTKRQGSKELQRIDTVTFEDVSFKYSSENVLNNFSLELKPGNFYTLHGANGSGKSTIVKLILGLYPPQSGKVKINDIAVNEYAQYSLNRQILYCGQDEIFPNGSIRNYMTLISHRTVNQDQYENLLSFVGLTDLHDIRDEGANLSGGQRKKLLIIKFLLRCEEVSLIILDEILSGLDKETSEKFIKFLDGVDFSQKTVVTIEHTNPAYTREVSPLKIGRSTDNPDFE